MSAASQVKTAETPLFLRHEMSAIFLRLVKFRVNFELPKRTKVNFTVYTYLGDLVPFPKAIR